MSEEHQEEEGADYAEPRPLGLVVCDSISRDVATGKFSLIGMFGVVISPTVPVKANFGVYATLTNVREDLQLKFIVVDDNDETIASIPENEWITLKKPPDIIGEPIVMAHFSGVEFPRYGSYFIQVWTQKRSIMERRILVLEPTPPKES